MSENACVMSIPISLPLNLAVTIKPDNLSTSVVTPNSAALLAVCIKSKSDTIPADAFLNDSSAFSMSPKFLSKPKDKLSILPALEAIDIIAAVAPPIAAVVAATATAILLKAAFILLETLSVLVCSFFSPLEALSSNWTSIIAFLVACPIIVFCSLCYFLTRLSPSPFLVFLNQPYLLLTTP